MPIITVDLFEGRSRTQREDFVKGVTKLAVEILKAPADHTWVIFREHSQSHWAMGGKLCDADRPQSRPQRWPQGRPDSGRKVRP